jgi:hypothetical protein
VAIFLHLLTIILVLNRVYSVNLKKVIDTLKVIGLITYYRFLQAEVARRSLDVINVFNFSYLQYLCEE